MPPTRDRIRAATLAVCREEGLSAVSMPKVAARVGVSAPAIYRHYRDKDDLLDAVADVGFAALAERLVSAESAAPPNGRDRLVALFDAGVAFALADEALFDLMFVARRAGARRFPDDFAAGRSPSVRVLQRCVEDGMRDGTLRADDPLETTLTLWAHTHGLLVLHFSRRLGDDDRFRALHRRSLERLLAGLAAS